jgi:hypothetical protein
MAFEIAASSGRIAVRAARMVVTLLFALATLRPSAAIGQAVNFAGASQLLSARQPVADMTSLHASLGGIWPTFFLQRQA